MIVASYIVAVLSVVSGIVTASFGVLIWARTLDMVQVDSERGVSTPRNMRVIGYVVGLAFAGLGFVLVYAGTEIWP